MKKYIVSSIVALVALAAINIMASEPQASPRQQLAEKTICHQRDQGVIVCPNCNGRGKMGGKMDCMRCRGRGILKSNGSPL